MAYTNPELFPTGNSKINDAKEILKALGFPDAQQNERSALVLLALSGLSVNDSWKSATATSMSVVGNKNNAKYPGIMRFISKHYKKIYAENSRETIRRQTLHQFVQAGMVEYNPDAPETPTTSKNNHYKLSSEALQLIRAYRSRAWKKELNIFHSVHGKLKEKYAGKREMNLLPLKLQDGTELKFSAGGHNLLQIAIINEFAPRFAPGCILLYVGDTANKGLYAKIGKLKQLNIPYNEHAKLPDIIIYDPQKDWLFLIEAVTTHGPFSPKRIIELERFLKECKSGKVYVSAFPDFRVFKKYSNEIAWETEVWIATKEMFDHMIHYNGDKFIGPRS